MSRISSSTDPLTDTLNEFAALVESVRPFRDLPCVCDESSEEAKEETLSRCTPCHVNSILDETMGQARADVAFLHRMAEEHPKEPLRAQAQTKPKVLKFQPASRKPQPSAIWKP